MSNILITGATGNIGLETIKGLYEINTSHRIYAGVRDIDKAKEALKDFPKLSFCQLDFSDPSTFSSALEGMDLVFLLRPPQLADVKKDFEPFTDAMLNCGITKIVFLSVQGVEKQKSIPHHKIEALLSEKKFAYIFLRPSYFMQNLSSSLLPEIRSDAKIFVPSGRLKFTWVDTVDIGLVAAHILSDFESYKNMAYEITGSEQEGFEEVAKMLSAATGKEIRYESPNLLKFYRVKRRLGIPKMMIFVMIMLHYLPRFAKKENNLATTVRDITGREPGTLAAYFAREKENFL